MLCNYQPQLRDMHQWLEDEKRAGVFQGPVYGPLGLDITVQDHLRYAKPVEAVRRAALVHRIALLPACAHGADGLYPAHIEFAEPLAVHHPSKAVHSMLHDFAVTCRADEERVSAKLKALGLRSRVHAHTKPLDAPYPALVGPASQYARCVVAGCSLLPLVF